MVEISDISTVFSVLYFAEEINLSLSLTGFPRGGFPRAD